MLSNSVQIMANIGKVAAQIRRGITAVVVLLIKISSHCGYGIYIIANLKTNLGHQKI